MSFFGQKEPYFCCSNREFVEDKHRISFTLGFLDALILLHLPVPMLLFFPLVSLVLWILLQRNLLMPFPEVKFSEANFLFEETTVKFQKYFIYESFLKV